MTAIDVGQGDSILLVTPTGRTLLVDAGGLPYWVHSDLDIGEDVVSPYLWSRAISRLDAVAITHAHADHLSAAPYIQGKLGGKLGIGENITIVQSVFGILGGIGTHPEDVMMMKRTADRLLGDNYHWSVLGAGGAQMRIAAQAAAMGGNVRVGMEDSLWIGAGRLAESNAQQVTQVRKILEGLGYEIANPDEAREILSLKGGDKVNF